MNCINDTHYRPRRSALYVPAHKVRYIEKSRTLNADCIIFDLQESVPPARKAEARQHLVEQLENSDFGYSERIVRVNKLSSTWGAEDLAAIARLDIDGVLFPNIESADEMHLAIAALDAAGGENKFVMANIESPLGVLRAEEIAASSDRLTTIVMGTSDLANSLRINVTLDRQGLLTYLSMCILAARAHHKSIIDGPHFNLKDVVACEYSCRQARDLGFDGKAVIHPIQLTYTNDALTPKGVDIRKAKDIISAMEQANAEGQSVAVIDDRLIEPCLEQWANRVICLYNKVKEYGQSELLGRER
ncbi:HpcH/HpaI aldolase/citrate lyase family protein [Thalassotalea sp. ND16A]|uniref:HpcH/HpaI aldolase/citrate lyase family protein n=1 Tax=Thalassotalea sp. ND16A TaxID=1535422 RepID=UPI00051A0411|nr:CoA ester lyase [Thalassotalea sp. ND16A]KGJ98062.1 Citryl-CoA lyase [Thalassotalea sp. ND16A]